MTTIIITIINYMLDNSYATSLPFNGYQQSKLIYGGSYLILLLK